MYAAFVGIHGGIAVEGFGANFAQVGLAGHGARMLAHEMLFEASLGQDGVAEMALLEIVLHLLPGLVVVEAVDAHQVLLESDDVFPADVAGRLDDAAFVQPVEPVVERRREKGRQDDLAIRRLFPRMTGVEVGRQVALGHDLGALAALHLDAVTAAFVDVFFHAADGPIRLDEAFGTGIPLADVNRRQVALAMETRFESQSLAIRVRTAQIRRNDGGSRRANSQSRCC